jgi:hypothetical protein
MQIKMEKRAEVALGSLDSIRRGRVNRALAELRVPESEQVGRSRKLIRLKTTIGGRLYAFRVDARLRLACSPRARQF